MTTTNHFPTVFITGSGSGIGQATVQLFLAKKWQVVATVKHLESAKNFPQTENLLVLPLDVTKADQLTAAYQAALKRFGGIDVLVNNAGYGLLGPLEELSLAEIRQQFEVNFFGLVMVTKQFLPYFRKQQSGRIINVSSMFGKISMPYLSVYGASKHAIEGLSEALDSELQGTGVSVKLIEPGAIKTKFFRNAGYAKTLEDSAYNPAFKKFVTKLKKNDEQGDSPMLVANAIFQAATTESKKFRWVTDKASRLLILLHRWLPFSAYQRALLNHFE